MAIDDVAANCSSDPQIFPSLRGSDPAVVQCCLGPHECPCQMACHSVQRL